MAEAKSELFETDVQHIADFYKALGHPARVAILAYLAKSSCCFTGDICNELPLSRTTVNQHLAELKRVGLIKGEVAGNKTNYCLNACVISEFEKQSSVLLAHLADVCDHSGCNS